MICRFKGKNSVVIFVIIYNRGLMGDFTQLIHIKSPVLSVLVIILPVGIIKHVTKTGSKEDGPFLFLGRIYAYRRF